LVIEPNVPVDRKKPRQLNSTLECPPHLDVADCDIKFFGHDPPSFYNLHFGLFEMIMADSD